MVTRGKGKTVVWQLGGEPAFDHSRRFAALFDVIKTVSPEIEG
jgi:hypothetical protein